MPLAQSPAFVQVPPRGLPPEVCSFELQAPATTTAVTSASTVVCPRLKGRFITPK
jgi:hypothetical protein